VGLMAVDLDRNAVLTVPVSQQMNVVKFVDQVTHVVLTVNVVNVAVIKIV
jgi:hypothetical protein